MGLVGRARLGRSDLVLAIADPVDDHLLGCIGIHRIGARAVPRSAMLPDEVGYWIAREVRGRGLVTRAVRMLSAYALAELGVGSLNLQTKVGNAASQHVATNVGYRYVECVPATEVDDDLSDHDRFVMTRDDYQRCQRCACRRRRLLVAGRYPCGHVDGVGPCVCALTPSIACSAPAGSR